MYQIKNLDILSSAQLGIRRIPSCHMCVNKFICNFNCNIVYVLFLCFECRMMNFCLDCFNIPQPANPQLADYDKPSFDISFFKPASRIPQMRGAGVRIIFRLVCVCPQRTNHKMRDAELIESSLYYFAFPRPATHKLRNAGCGTINKLAKFVLLSHPAKPILRYFVFAVNCKMLQPATREMWDAGFGKY